MPKFLLFVLFLLLNFHFTQATPRADSLHREMELVEGFEKVQVLNGLSREYWMQDPFLSLAYGRQALDLANSLGYTQGAALATRNIGVVFYLQADYTTALEYFNEALRFYEHLGADRGKGAVLNNLGITYLQTGNYDFAINYLLEALHLAGESKGGQAIAMNNLGKVYSKLKDKETAINYYRSALKHYEALGESREVATTYNNLGMICLDFNEYAKAVEYFNLSVAISKKYNSLNRLAQSFEGLSQVFTQLKDYQLATSLIHVSISLRDQLNDKLGLAASYHDLSKIQFLTQNGDKAILTLRKSEKLAEVAGVKEILLKNKQLFSALYEQKGDYKLAFDYQAEALTIKEDLFNENLAKNLEGIQLKQQAAKSKEVINLKNLELSQNRIFSYFLLLVIALIAITVFLIYSRYQINIRTSAELERRNLEIYHQKEKIQKQKEVLQTNNQELEDAQKIIKKQNDSLTKINNRLEHIVKERTQELWQSNAELQNTNEELDTFIYKTSHDIRGPLARLMGLCNVALLDVKDQKSLDYFKMLNNTANNLNNILKRLMMINKIKNIELKMEPINFQNAVKDAIKNCQHIAGYNTLHFDIEIEEGLKFISDINLIKLILNNIVENAVKFYNPYAEMQSFVRVCISTTDEHVAIKITDNGLGIDASQYPFLFDMFSRTGIEQEKGGLGLYLTKLSVEKLQGTIKLHPNIHRYTEFVILLPLVTVASPTTKSLIAEFN